jgi:hypothetical protein
MNHIQKNEASNFLPIIRGLYFDLSKGTENNFDSHSRKSQYFLPQYAGKGVYYFSRIYFCLIFTDDICNVIEYSMLESDK